jgi:hypothetical protein
VIRAEGIFAFGLRAFAIAGTNVAKFTPSSLFLLLLLLLVLLLLALVCRISGGCCFAACKCVRACMCACLCVTANLRICTCVFVCVYVCMCMYMCPYVCIFVCLCLYNCLPLRSVRVHVCMSVCVCVCVCVCVHVCASSHRKYACPHISFAVSRGASYPIRPTRLLVTRVQYRDTVSRVGDENLHRTGGSVGYLHLVEKYFWHHFQKKLKIVSIVFGK